MDRTNIGQWMGLTWGIGARDGTNMGAMDGTNIGQWMGLTWDDGWD